jgi:hypothetical protein
MQWIAKPPIKQQPISSPIRTLLARCLSLLYEIGETRSLFTNANTLISQLPNSQTLNKVKTPFEREAFR